MKIAQVEVRCCHRSAEGLGANALRGQAFQGFEFLVVP